MASPASKSETQTQQLYLLFRIGTDRYAIDVRNVVEVLALRPLKQLPGAPAWVAGLLQHRDRALPVLDLSARAGFGGASHKTSTRLVLVQYRPEPDSPEDQLLGLVLEQVNDTLRCREIDFHDYGLDSPEHRYLGPVLEHPLGVIQRITLTALLPADVRRLLYPPRGQSA